MTQPQPWLSSTVGKGKQALIDSPAVSHCRCDGGQHWVEARAGLSKHMPFSSIILVVLSTACEYAKIFIQLSI